MADLNIDAGLKSYNINGKCEVLFNPTDITFMQAIYDTFARLEKLQADNKRELDAAKGTERVFEFAVKRDAEMRGEIDGLFGGAPVSEAAFGTVNCYALSDGLPLWTNLLLAVIDEMDDSVKEQKKLSSPRIDKYLKKYR